MHSSIARIIRKCEGEVRRDGIYQRENSDSQMGANSDDSLRIMEKMNNRGSFRLIIEINDYTTSAKTPSFRALQQLLGEGGKS